MERMWVWTLLKLMELLAYKPSWMQRGCCTVDNECFVLEREKESWI